ncbi:hypothetical protein ABZ612_35225 [Streptomyces avermitilis]|uniref:hypothetical protein n=1 Tax=Streptomyces avermitilis TaxID=33903 RepID=UPI0033E1B94E
MSRQGRTSYNPGPRDVAAGLTDLQGYLMAHAALQEAHTRAESFADTMPWLTTPQREEVIRLYAEDDMVRNRHAWRTIYRRARQLNDEYTARYEELRRRLQRRNVVGWLLITVAASALCTLAALHR